MWAAALLLALVTLPRAALAQESGEASLERAVVLFEESETLYNQGEFVEAAALLRRAYALHADPTLLFNLGRALEGAGDLDGAIDAYARYLATAEDPPDRGAVEGRLATLRAQRDALAGGGRDEAREAPEPPTTSPGGGGGVEVAPWIVAGGGVLVLGTAIVLGVVSQDLGSQAAVEPVQADAVALHADAETFALAANVLYVAGGVIAAAGAVWGIVSLTSGDGGSQASLRFGPGSIALAGRF